MHDIVPFAITLLLVALALLIAVGSNQLAQRVRVPAPALFLVLAAGASAVFPGLRGLSIVNDQRIVTVALVIILFDGGMRIGWKRMRPAAGAVVWLGVMGTVVTAGAVALCAHLIFGLDWRAALLIGAALAPTDPAVVFSVLGRREITGRSGVLLEGESGANDPVGIALMVALLGESGGGWSAVGSGVGYFVLQLAVGALFGVLGAWLLLQLTRRMQLPNEALYSVRTIAFALLLYAGTAAVHGSGFLAVFLAGVLIGDEPVPYKRETGHFVSALASLSEIVAFVVLGLSVNLATVFHASRIWTALGLAALLILAIRPLLVGLVLWPVRLSRGERLFVLLSGLKGAVPILLGTYVLAEQSPHAQQIYDIVFVVVLLSVVLQGGGAPTLAAKLGVPMRTARVDS